MNSAVVFTSEQLTILNTLNAWYLTSKFDAGNTASGTDVVEINGNSGVATFTNTISSTDYATFTITNENVIFSPMSIVNYGMINNSEQANLICVRFSIEEGTLIFVLHNESGFDSDVPIKIWFQILNP